MVYYGCCMYQLNEFLQGVLNECDFMLKNPARSASTDSGFTSESSGEIP
jgi:hypothetical protein